MLSSIIDAVSFEQIICPVADSLFSSSNTMSSAKSRSLEYFVRVRLYTIIS